MPSDFNHQSAFLVGLHGAIQAASQAPQSQASSKYMHRLFLITAGRHQLGSNLISISYHQWGIPITSQWSSQEGNGELQVQFSPPIFEDTPGKSHVGRHVGRTLRSKQECPLRCASSQEHWASALQGCWQMRFPVLS